METTTQRKTFFTAGRLALIVALAVVLIDQIVKILVKTTFYLGEENRITSWFRIAFVENDGMAFGWAFGSKLLLTVFRIVFVGLLVWFLIVLRRSTTVKKGFIICAALVLAGAIGNIIDCVFYGVIFNDPTPTAVASLFPEGGGYAPLLHGKVVDMLYFPLFSFNWPEWMPFVGGEHFEFFKPVFNIADAAISVGIIAILVFYYRHTGEAVAEFKRLRKKSKDSNSSESKNEINGDNR